MVERTLKQKWEIDDAPPHELLLESTMDGVMM
jgi:hypothetical protein